MPVSLTLSFDGPPPAVVAAVPMAVGDPRPAWPLAQQRRTITGDFGDVRWSDRGGRRVERVHVAEDLPAQRGTAVFATEAGRVVDVLDEFYKGSGYVLIQGDSGLVFVLGEVEPGSVMVRPGERVTKGQPVARVGRHAQLHFETYASGTRRTYQWWADEPPPPRLRNPTSYLQAAAVSHDPTKAPSLPPMRPPPPKPMPADPEPLAPAPAVARNEASDGLLLLALAVLGGAALG